MDANAEVDGRRLYARFASSMFTYCTEVLHLSEHEAYLRIAVARASRKHPMLLEMLADGRLHLSGIAKLAPREKAKPTPPPLLGPDQVVPRVVPSTVRPAMVQPLAPKRYKMQFTASAELRDKQGRRCTGRSRLEFHHRQPFGRGGDHSPENVYLICHAHNGYLAERDYGREVMERYRRSPSRVSEPPPIYSAGIRAAQIPVVSSLGFEARVRTP